ncbi:MAG: hypothetical protein K1X79_12100 [Oligoflexia bacterium]|nr:hypothetical protein [Oligoflexia bacterium]
MGMYNLSSVNLRVPNININVLLRKKSVERLVVGTKILMLLLMVFCAIQIIREGLDNRLAASAAISTLESETQAAEAAAADHGSKKNHKRDYDAIARSNLFGPLGTQMQQKPAEPAKPVVKSAFTLIGTFIVTGDGGTAIIEDQKKKTQDVFSVGDMVFGEAKLVEIQSDRVILDRSGNKEELVMEDLATDKGSSGPVEFKEGIAFVSENEVLVQEPELDKALENLPLLLTQARAVPYFKDGKSIGLRLFAVKQGSLFERLGLKNGDILKAINSNPLGDLSQAIKLFETLKQERSINVQLERERNDREVHYQIR